MELDSLQEALRDFDKKTKKEASPLLEQFLCHVAKTGETMVPWSQFKNYFLFKLEEVMDDFRASAPEQRGPANPNVESIPFEDMKERILKIVKGYNGIPFTIQRLCELLTEPKRNYTGTDKFLRGVEKNVMVVSCIHPTSEKNGCSAVNRMNGVMLPGNTSAFTERKVNGPGTPRPLNRPKVSLANSLAANGLPDSTDSKDLSTDPEEDTDNSEVSESGDSLGSSMKNKHPETDEEMDAGQQEVKRLKFSNDEEEDDDDEDEEEEQEVDALRPLHTTSKEAEAMVHEEEDQVSYSKESETSSSATALEDQGDRSMAERPDSSDLEITPDLPNLTNLSDLSGVEDPMEGQSSQSGPPQPSTSQSRPPPSQVTPERPPLLRLTAMRAQKVQLAPGKAKSCQGQRTLATSGRLFGFREPPPSQMPWRQSHVLTATTLMTGGSRFRPYVAEAPVPPRPTSLQGPARGGIDPFQPPREQEALYRLLNASMPDQSDAPMHTPTACSCNVTFDTPPPVHESPAPMLPLSPGLHDCNLFMVTQQDMDILTQEFQLRPNPKIWGQILVFANRLTGEAFEGLMSRLTQPAAYMLRMHRDMAEVVDVQDVIQSNIYGLKADIRKLTNMMERMEEDRLETATAALGAVGNSLGALLQLAGSSGKMKSVLKVLGDRLHDIIPDGPSSSADERQPSSYSPTSPQASDEE